jgi:hypothetical protein
MFKVLRTTRVSILGLPFESFEKKCHLDVTLVKKIIEYTIKRRMVPPSKGYEPCKACA